MNKDITLKEDNPVEEIPTVTGEVVDDDDIDIDDLMPQMNVISQEPKEKKPDLISDAQLTGIYDEILGMLRNEHTQVTDYIDNFAEMVINGGDVSTSSKEALVNLVKIRTDIPDKMVKVADLMTRLKLKNTESKSTVNASQTNLMIGDTTGERRTLLDAIKKAKKKGKK